MGDVYHDNISSCHIVRYRITIYTYHLSHRNVESTLFRQPYLKTEKRRSRLHQPSYRSSICFETFTRIGFGACAVYEGWKIIVFNISFYSREKNSEGRFYHEMIILNSFRVAYIAIYLKVHLYLQFPSSLYTLL